MLWPRHCEPAAWKWEISWMLGKQASLAYFLNQSQLILTQEVNPQGKVSIPLHYSVKILTRLLNGTWPTGLEMVAPFPRCTMTTESFLLLKILILYTPLVHSDNIEDYTMKFPQVPFLDGWLPCYFFFLCLNVTFTVHQTLLPYTKVYNCCTSREACVGKICQNTTENSWYGCWFLNCHNS